MRARPPRDDPDSLPCPFGPYMLLARLGSGGMADVYLAKARGIGGFEKLLCIKRIRSRHADRDDFMTQLIEEAKIVAHISHPNVVQVFDLGVVDGQHYLAMEYVDGVDASMLIRRAASAGVLMPPVAAAQIARDVASGLSAAHSQQDRDGKSLQIIHRDVSPHNVLIGFGGDVKVTDFGIAKATLRAEQTQAGIIKGKYQYLSPEQARGERIDHRSDIFATGLVLFELLAGVPMYAGDDVGDILRKAQARQAPDVQALRPDVPRPLRRILNRALKRAVRSRYASADDMAHDLDRFLMEHGEGRGRRELAATMDRLFPSSDRPSRDITGPEGLPAMGLRDYISHSQVSIVSAPEVSITDEPPDFDAAPTRIVRRPELAETPALRTPSDTARIEATPRRGRPLAWLAVGALLTGVASLGGWYLLGAAATGEPGLLIVSEPGGAEVILDGEPTGVRTPGRLTQGLVAGQRRSVGLRLAGYEPWEGVVDIGDEEGRLRVTLNRARPVLRIRSEPSGARVEVDGEQRGVTPLVLRDLDPVAAASIDVSLPGHRPYHVEHRFEGRSLVTLTARLEAEEP